MQDQKSIFGAFTVLVVCGHLNKESLSTLLVQFGGETLLHPILDIESSTVLHFSVAGFYKARVLGAIDKPEAVV